MIMGSNCFRLFYSTQAEEHFPQRIPVKPSQVMHYAHFRSLLFEYLEAISAHFVDCLLNRLIPPVYCSEFYSYKNKMIKMLWRDRCAASVVPLTDARQEEGFLPCHACRSTYCRLALNSSRSPGGCKSRRWRVGWGGAKTRRQSSSYSYENQMISLSR